MLLGSWAGKAGRAASPVLSKEGAKEVLPQGPALPSSQAILSYMPTPSQDALLRTNYSPGQLGA